MADWKEFTLSGNNEIANVVSLLDKSIMVFICMCRLGNTFRLSTFLPSFSNHFVRPRFWYATLICSWRFQWSVSIKCVRHSFIYICGVDVRCYIRNGNKVKILLQITQKVRDWGLYLYNDSLKKCFVLEAEVDTLMEALMIRWSDNWGLYTSQLIQAIEEGMQSMFQCVSMNMRWWCVNNRNVKCIENLA